MPKILDYTKINWDEEFSFDAPLQDIKGTMSGEGAIQAGDQIVMCISCRVDEVEHYANSPEQWRASVSGFTPISIEAMSEQSQMQLIEQLTTRLSAPLRQTELYGFFERLFTADGVTQAATRARFDALLAKEWQRGLREQTPLSVILFRIAGLTFDDEESSANACLQSVAALLQDSIKRSSDVVARYQDDTFVLLLPNTPQASAAQLAKTIHPKVMGTLAEMKTASPHPLTLHQGIAGIVPNQDISFADLMEAAETSLSR